MAKRFVGFGHCKTFGINNANNGVSYQDFGRIDTNNESTNYGKKDLWDWVQGSNSQNNLRTSYDQESLIVKVIRTFIS